MRLRRLFGYHPADGLPRVTILDVTGRDLRRLTQHNGVVASETEASRDVVDEPRETDRK